MKIGIITLHASENFGSVLQAFALQSYLSELGHEAYIIDYVYTNDYKQYGLFYVAPGYILKSLVKDVLYFNRKVKRKKAFKEFSKRYLHLTVKRFFDSEDLSELNDEFDAFICGSDQIWNPNCLKKVVPAFFLDFVKEGKKKIAYAPSMPADPGEQYYEQIRKFINHLDSISVREKSSIEVLKQKIGIKKEITDICDPTLLLPGDFYINLFDLKSNRKNYGQGGYIFVYILGDIGASNQVIKEAINLHNMFNLPIFYVSNRTIKEFSEKENRFLLGIGPRDFLMYIYNAHNIITDSFHATVFSILFNRDFISFGRSGSESRVKNLLFYLDLLDCYSDNCSIDSTPKNVSYKLVNNKVDVIRKTGEAYLIDALS